jgi:hypothetical protein
MAEDSLFGRESAFYLALWEHLDALCARNRWLQSSERRPFKDRRPALRDECEQLLTSVSEKEAQCLKTQLKTTLNLGDAFLEKENDPVLLHRIEEWKNTLQTLGLECARLEALNGTGPDI